MVAIEWRQKKIRPCKYRSSLYSSLEARSSEKRIEGVCKAFTNKECSNRPKILTNFKLTRYFIRIFITSLGCYVELVDTFKFISVFLGRECIFRNIHESIASYPCKGSQSFRSRYIFKIQRYSRSTDCQSPWISHVDRTHSHIAQRWSYGSGLKRWRIGRQRNRAGLAQIKAIGLQGSLR